MYVGENLGVKDITPKGHFRASGGATLSFLIQWLHSFVIVKGVVCLSIVLSHCSFYCYMRPVTLQSILSSSLISIYSWTDLGCTVYSFQAVTYGFSYAP